MQNQKKHPRLSVFIRELQVFNNEVLQEFAGCNRTIPTRNPVATQKRSVIPTNTQFLAAFRATEEVARQNPKDPITKTTLFLLILTLVIQWKATLNILNIS